MLDDMALDLMNWLEKKILLNSLTNGIKETFSEELKIKWDMYYKNKDKAN